MNLLKFIYPEGEAVWFVGGAGVSGTWINYMTNTLSAMQFTAQQVRITVSDPMGYYSFPWIGDRQRGDEKSERSHA